MAADAHVPTSVHALLRRLHLVDAPRQRQEEAIAVWMDGHQVGEYMAFTLRRNGFGHLLDERGLPELGWNTP